MNRFRYPTYVRLPAPRKEPKRQSGKVRRCGRNGHNWCHWTMQCTRCGCWWKTRPLGLLARSFLAWKRPQRGG